MTKKEQLMADLKKAMREKNIEINRKKSIIKQL